VLIVEDSPLCAKVCALMLSRAGCTSHVVGDGAQAVAALEASASDYDLVMMDLRMPVMDGFEATRISKQRLGVSLPIVAMTAESGFETRALCEESGFDDVSTKPVKLATIVQLLEKHVKGIAAP
ncbi:receiver domain of response regulator from bacterial two component system, partial [Pelagophyceae sp. CCMP2097]